MTCQSKLILSTKVSRYISLPHQELTENVQEVLTFADSTEESEISAAVGHAEFTHRTSMETGEGSQRGPAEEEIAREGRRLSTYPTMPQRFPLFMEEANTKQYPVHYNGGSVAQAHHRDPSVESLMPDLDNTTSRLTSPGVSHNVRNSQAIADTSTLDPQLFHSKRQSICSSFTMSSSQQQSTDVNARFAPSAQRQRRLSTKSSAQSINQMSSVREPLYPVGQGVQDHYPHPGTTHMPPIREMAGNTEQRQARTANRSFGMPTNQHPFGSHVTSEAHPYTHIDPREVSRPLTGAPAAQAAGMTVGDNGIPLPHDTHNFRRPPGDARDEILKRREQERERSERFTRQSAEEHNPVEGRNPARYRAQREGQKANDVAVPWEDLGRRDMWGEEDAEGEDEDEYDASK